MSDADGLAQWQSDIRKVMTFTGAVDVAAKRDGVLYAARRWLAIPA